MKNQFTRRHFLRGTGALIALPALGSLGFRQFASAATNKSGIPPKRAVFFGMGFGVTKETWFPDINKTGADYKLSEGLSPLARHQSDLTVVQGCANRFTNEAHWGSTFWLTGANRYSVAGQNMANSISVDQVVAQYLGQETRFSSLQLNASELQGHGPGLSLAWDQRGKPVAGHNDPVQIFHTLFSADALPLEQRQAAIAENRSVLDAIHSEAKRVQQALSKTGTEKLDEYLILPGLSPYLKIEQQGNEYLVAFNGEEMRFLVSDTQVLPIRNATVEEFASYLLGQLMQDSDISLYDVRQVEMKVSSGPGQWGSCMWVAGQATAADPNG